jgi:hypothetical protein
VLAEAVSAILPPLDAVLEDNRPASELADHEVLKWADAQLPAVQDRRLSELLDKQQAATLSEPDRTELFALMQLYEASLPRQADALAEAVRRGLREPLAPGATPCLSP